MSYGITNNVTVYSGNLVFVQFQAPNGTVNYVGLGQTATINQDAGLQAASGIGDNRVKQWVPGMAQVTVNVADMAINSQSYESLGLAPSTSLTDILTLGLFTITIVDQTVDPQTGAYSLVPIKQVIDCLYAQGSLNITKHAPLTANVTFNGLDVSGQLVYVPSTGTP